MAAVRAGEGGDQRRRRGQSTFHAAKGLEWPVVHLAGLEDGLVPIAYATTPGALAEEQRLLYVAITRAEDELRLHWSRTRVQGGEARERSPSPWLAPIEAALLDLQVASRPVDGRQHLTAPRADLHAHHPEMDADPDEAVDRLEAWRAQAARAARVPEQAIVDDRTLHAIADARPSSTKDLRGSPASGRSRRPASARRSSPPSTPTDPVRADRGRSGSRRARSSSTRSRPMLMKMPSASAVSRSPA